jgi:hypothetical protein
MLNGLGPTRHWSAQIFSTRLAAYYETGLHPKFAAMDVRA